MSSNTGDPVCLGTPIPSDAWGEAQTCSQEAVIEAAAGGAVPVCVASSYGER